jgi:hypothetical protein
VAKALSPRLARKQRYLKTSRTRVGDLMMFTGSDTAETAPAWLPNNGVVTTAAPGSATFDPTLSKIYFDQSWVSRPARKTWAGSTLLLGDSFTYTALEPLRNLFARGRFMWLGFTDPAKVVDAVVRADTVVLTVVQRYIHVSPLQNNVLRAELKAALKQNKK